MAKPRGRKRRTLTEHPQTDAIFVEMGMKPPSADEWRALAFALGGTLCTQKQVPEMLDTTMTEILRDIRAGGGPAWLPPWQKETKE